MSTKICFDVASNDNVISKNSKTTKIDGLLTAVPLPLVIILAGRFTFFVRLYHSVNFTGFYILQFKLFSNFH